MVQHIQWFPHEFLEQLGFTPNTHTCIKMVKQLILSAIKLSSLRIRKNKIYTHVENPRTPMKFTQGNSIEPGFHTLCLLLFINDKVPSNNFLSSREDFLRIHKK